MIFFQIELTRDMLTKRIQSCRRNLVKSTIFYNPMLIEIEIGKNHTVDARQPGFFVHFCTVRLSANRTDSNDRVLFHPFQQGKTWCKTVKVSTAISNNKSSHGQPPATAVFYVPRVCTLYVRYRDTHSTAFSENSDVNTASKFYFLSDARFG